MTKLNIEVAEDLKSIFSHHAPNGSQQVSYQALRDAAHAFAIAIMAHAPACADRTTAIRKVREALMTANVAIALDGGI